MGQTASGENRKLLAADQGGQAVNSRNSGADIVSGILTCYRVQGLAVYIQADIGNNIPQPVDGLSDAVKGPAQHFLGHCYLHGPSGQPGMGIPKSHALGTFKNLDHRFIPIDFNNFSDFLFCPAYSHLHDLIVGRSLDSLQSHQGTIDLT